MQGMSKGSGTRSGLLWEVERLLNEINELPQVLLMENVPQVISRKNMSDFHKWQEFLESKGYTNYVEILNAKDFGVAQNRERCFMVSLLGKWNYKFPQPIPLKKTMADYLEDEVDEKYYINSEKAQKLIQQLIDGGQLGGCIGNINPSGNGINGNVFSSDGLAPALTTNKGEGPKICTDLSINNPKVTDISNCITARQDRGISNHQGVGGAVVEQIRQIGNYKTESTWDNPQTGRVYSADGISPTLNTCNGGDRQPKIVEPQIKQVGNLTENAKRDNPQRRRVYDTTGISPALCEQMGTGGNLQPFIVTSRGRNPQNPSDRTPGNHVEQRLEPNSEGLCNTLTSVQKDNMVLESTVKIKQATKDGYIECKLGGVADLSYPTSKTRRGRVQDNGDTCPTLTAAETGVCRIETPYRIRKLTPLECAKLMNFTEEDVNKMMSVNSNTQVYKQCGNSICTNVLQAIFCQMNIKGCPTWEEYAKEHYL